MLVDNGKSGTDVYDTTTLQPLVHLTFPSRIVHAEFLENPYNIFILTADQTVYQLQSPGKEETAGVH